jgi:hypothetical protein
MGKPLAYLVGVSTLMGTHQALMGATPTYLGNESAEFRRCSVVSDDAILLVEVYEVAFF